jgi:hypothetical protein
MGAKVARWLVFSVLFSLVPICASYALAIASSTTVVPPLSSVVKHGDFYLLSSVLSAVGLGEVIGANQKFQVYKIITGGVSCLIIGFSTFLFVYASTSELELVELKLAYASYWMFVFACIVATSCVVLSEI